VEHQEHYQQSGKRLALIVKHQSITKINGKAQKHRDKHRKAEGRPPIIQVGKQQKCLRSIVAMKFRGSGMGQQVTETGGLSLADSSGMRSPSCSTWFDVDVWTELGLGNLRQNE
jgi:hypothetical protein